jgi:hypothetical protein
MRTFLLRHFPDGGYGYTTLQSACTYQGEAQASWWVSEKILALATWTFALNYWVPLDY